MNIQNAVKELAEIQGLDITEIEEVDDNLFLIDGEEWLVLTDMEANYLQDEYLDAYIEDCIMPELPEYLQAYFDCKSWKLDAEYACRGVYLAPYNHEEVELYPNHFAYRVG